MPPAQPRRNGDIYEDELGPKYDGLKQYWANPNAEGRAKLRQTVSEEGFREEGGHWALETNLEEIVALTRDFLGRVHN